MTSHLNSELGFPRTFIMVLKIGMSFPDMLKNVRAKKVLKKM